MMRSEHETYAILFEIRFVECAEEFVICRRAEQERG